MGHVSNAAAYLFSEFDRLHILESDLFTDDRKFDNRGKLTPDPAVKAEFEKELTKSTDLANKILAQNSQDKNALFSLVLANGLRGDYTAMIEKRNLASLAYMKTSRGDGRKAVDHRSHLLRRLPRHRGGELPAGQHPAPVRWVLRMTGSQTDKEEGVQRLRLTADKGHYLAPFARLLLAVAALRDKDRQTARTLLASLATEFPGNQLYAKELARIQ